MFNFLRNITKSAEEKRQEAVAAYLDGMLNQREQRRFEQEMAQDAALQVRVEQLRLVKQRLRQLPQREVPRNFILDPAQYGRPARQPWVQAYPVLRTATALAAFFFIFAAAAGIFTGFGTDKAVNLAPAADVAQIEAVEVTRTVSEEVDSLAFEPAADEAMEEEASGDAAEVPLEDAAIEAEAEMMEEAADAEPAAEAEVPPPASAATEPASANTAVPQATESLQDDTSEAEDGAAASAASAAAATPTVSTLPRVTPTTPLPERELELDELEDVANTGGEAAEAGVAEDSQAAVSVTAVPDQSSSSDSIIQSANLLPWLQIGLGLLLLLLAGLTFYARRQR